MGKSPKKPRPFIQAEIRHCGGLNLRLITTCSRFGACGDLLRRSESDGRGGNVLAEEAVPLEQVPLATQILSFDIERVRVVIEGVVVKF